MIIHVYTMCYNEEILMPYFLRHYGSFADRIFVFDHYSEDSTALIVDSCPKTVRVLTGVKGIHDDRNLTNVKNEAYKNSRGKVDWVMVVDTDEFVYHPQLLDLLEEYKTKGITLPKTTGCDMISDEIPSHSGQIYEIIKSGVFDDTFSKRAVFNPTLNICYHKGAHLCDPIGNVIESEKSEIKILHYRFLSADFAVNRLVMRTKRLSRENIKNGWGVIPCENGESIKESILKSYNKRRELRISLI